MKYLALILALLVSGVQAKEVGRYAGESFGIVLYNDKGRCEEGTEAVYISKEGTVWGCWVNVLAMVVVKWDDGDVTMRPEKEFLGKGV